ncbi:MAG: hypothetical protein QXM75_02195 [Candidatus Diapherotrites archaeon]
MSALKIPLLEKAIIFLISFIIVVYVLVRFRVWGNDFIRYFFMTERWPELIFVVLITAALSMFFSWMLRLEFRLFTDFGEKYRKR